MSQPGEARPLGGSRVKDQLSSGQGCVCCCFSSQDQVWAATSLPQLLELFFLFSEAGKKCHILLPPKPTPPPSPRDRVPCGEVPVTTGGTSAALSSSRYEVPREAQEPDSSFSASLPVLFEEPVPRTQSPLRQPLCWVSRVTFMPCTAWTRIRGALVWSWASLTCSGLWSLCESVCFPGHLILNVGAVPGSLDRMCWAHV